MSTGQYEDLSFVNKNCYPQPVRGRRFKGVQSLPLHPKDLTIDSLVHRFSNQDPNARFLFHGTSATNMYNIITNGIQLQYGRPNQDFSHTFAYCLSDHLEYATQWANVVTQGTIGSRAVLVYRVSMDDLRERFPNQYRCFDAPNDDWKQLICRNRTGQDSHPFLYEGPMCSNGSEVRYHGADPDVHNPLKNQLCLRTINQATYFDHALEVVFTF